MKVAVAVCVRPLPRPGPLPQEEEVQGGKRARARNRAIGRRGTATVAVSARRTATTELRCLPCPDSGGGGSERSFVEI